MNPDTISSYNRDSVPSIYPEGGANKSFSAGKNLPKDVLEALEQGNLDGALNLLKAHNAADAQMGIFYQMMAKLGLIFKKMAVNPFSKENLPKELKAEQPKPEQIKSQTLEKSILLYQQKIHELILMCATFGKNTAVAIYAKAEGMFNSLKNLTESFANTCYAKTEPLRRKLVQLLNKTSIKIHDGLEAATLLAQSILEKVKIPLVYLKSRLLKIKDKGIKIALKVTEAVTEVIKEHFVPPVEKFKKWALAHIEASMQKVTHTSQQVWQQLTIIAAPAFVAFQQMGKRGMEVAGYGVAHLRNRLKKMSASLQQFASSAYKRFIIVFLPPMLKVTNVLNRWIEYLLNQLLKILLWMWSWITWAIDVVPKFLLNVGKGIWILVKLVPTLCFAAVIGFGRNLSDALWQSLKR